MKKVLGKGEGFTSIARVDVLKVLTGRNFMNGDSEHCATFYGSVIFFVFQTPTPKTKKAEKGASRFFFLIVFSTISVSPSFNNIHIYKNCSVYKAWQVLHIFI